MSDGQTDGTHTPSSGKIRSTACHFPRAVLSALPSRALPNATDSSGRDGGHALQTSGNLGLAMPSPVVFSLHRNCLSRGFCVGLSLRYELSFLRAPARCVLSGPAWRSSHSLQCVIVICMLIFRSAPPRQRKKHGLRAPQASLQTSECTPLKEGVTTVRVSQGGCMRKPFPQWPGR